MLFKKGVKMVGKEKNGGDILTNLAIKDEIVTMLNYFGEPSQMANYALQDFLVKKCQEKISQAKIRIEWYEQKYQSNFNQFRTRIQSDEVYVNNIEEKVEKLWEEDILDWEYRIKELEEWKKKLACILTG